MTRDLNEVKKEGRHVNLCRRRVPEKCNGPEAGICLAILREQNKAYSWRKVSKRKNGGRYDWRSRQGLDSVGPYIGHIENIRFYCKFDRKP